MCPGDAWRGLQEEMPVIDDDNMSVMSDATMDTLNTNQVGVIPLRTEREGNWRRFDWYGLGRRLQSHSHKETPRKQLNRSDLFEIRAPGVV